MRPLKLVIDLPAHPAGVAALRQLGVEVICTEPSSPHPPAHALDPARAAGAAGLLCYAAPTNLEELPDLRWIQVSSTGYEQLLGLNLNERKIRATIARGCCDPQIAEWNLGMMVNLVRDVPRMIRNQAAAVWDKTPFQGEIRGRTVGFWGYGGIGRETARLARQLAMKVHVLTRHGVRPRTDIYAVAGTGDPEGKLPHRVFTAGQELEFLAGLDFLVLALPLTRASEGVIGERELRALPRTAYLLTPSRGKIVQEAALLRALDEGWFAGAALDTHHHYPLPPSHPLWRNPRAIVTPHMAGGGYTPPFAERLWDLLGQNAARFADGRPLLNELTPAELAGQ